MNEVSLWHWLVLGSVVFVFWFVYKVIRDMFK